MNKGGIGVGSASIVLIFAVLCLTVFSLITYIVATNSKALVDAEAKLVLAYYEADLLAERILAEILNEGDIPDTILGVDIETAWNWETDKTTVQFACPVSDERSLFVRLLLSGDSYDILSWRMWDAGEWAIDEGLNVWPGGFDEFFEDDQFGVWLFPDD